MAGSVHDGQIYSKLFNAGEAGRLFTDSAEVRSMLIVEGALAKAQGEMGMIPAVSGAFIHRASLEITIDPGALQSGAAKNGVSVPSLVAEFRKEMQAPEHAQYLHWGATSQDIADTGQMLRLRQLLVLCETGLRELLDGLAKLASDHADLPMAGRTYGQFATPVSFGSHVSAWGWPLLDLLKELPALRESALWVSLSGAAGTGAEFGGKGLELRAKLAEGLGLGDPGRSWHADRGPVLRIAGWLARMAQVLGKMGDDLILMAQSSASEVKLSASGGSSTMPQKQNPVQPSVLLACARQVLGLKAILDGAGMPRQERDGAAWFTEWLTLPQLCLSAAASLQTARDMVPGLTPKAKEMHAVFTDALGLLHAEALSFRLAGLMPRPEAQDIVKKLAQQVLATGRPLGELALEALPDLDLSGLFAPEEQMGDAPANARAFAAAVAAL